MIIGLWTEFEQGITEEAKLAKALDKLEVLIQHNEADIKTWVPEEFDMALTYGKKFTDYHPFVKKIRAVVDKLSTEKMAQAKR